jgi:hypothetical protein
VVYVYVGDHQGADVGDGEIDGQVASIGALLFFLALEQAAVYQDAQMGVRRWQKGGV